MQTKKIDASSTYSKYVLDHNLSKEPSYDGSEDSIL